MKSHIIGVIIGLLVTVGLAVLFAFAFAGVEPAPRQVAVAEKEYQPESTGITASGPVLIPTTLPERWFLHYEEPDGESSKVEVEQDMWEDIQVGDLIVVEDMKR